jgi:hypothetical protein
MSQRKDDHIWSCKKAEFLEQEIGEKVAAILRQEYAGKASPMKNISSKTGISSDTIRKWYSGRKPPYLGHFLILVQNYPAIMMMFLEAAGHDYLIPHVLGDSASDTAVKSAPDFPLDTGKNDTINDTIKSKTANLNERQVWFLENLRGGAKLTAHDICRQWSVFLRTSRRDIEELKELRLIRFAGAKKTGWYEMI